MGRDLSAARRAVEAAAAATAGDIRALVKAYAERHGYGNAPRGTFGVAYQHFREASRQRAEAAKSAEAA